MKNFLIICGLFLSLNTFSQVAVNADGSASDGSSMLELESTIKGMLIPRMTEGAKPTTSKAN